MRFTLASADLDLLKKGNTGLKFVSPIRVTNSTGIDLQFKENIEHTFIASISINKNQATSSLIRYYVVMIKHN